MNKIDLVKRKAIYAIDPVIWNQFGTVKNWSSQTGDINTAKQAYHNYYDCVGHQQKTWKPIRSVNLRLLVEWNHGKWSKIRWTKVRESSTRRRNSKFVFHWNWAIPYYDILWMLILNSYGGFFIYNRQGLHLWKHNIFVSKMARNQIIFKPNLWGSIVSLCRSLSIAESISRSSF